MHNTQTHAHIQKFTDRSNFKKPEMRGPQAGVLIINSKKILSNQLLCGCWTFEQPKLEIREYSNVKNSIRLGPS